MVITAPQIRATNRQTPVILSNFLDAYSAEFRCSRKVAAWELREAFAEMAAMKEKAGVPALLGRQDCWVGSVARPFYERRRWDVTYSQLVTYFERNMTTTEGPVEFIESALPTIEPRLVPDAAIAFNSLYLASMFQLIGRPIPAFLLYDPAPAESYPLKGRRKGSVRNLVLGVMEIASNAARKDRDSEFCKKAASLDPDEEPGTSARRLWELADELGIEGFPGKKPLKEILK